MIAIPSSLSRCRETSSTRLRWSRWPHRKPTLIHQRSLLTLAIETSCDDTAVAILETHDDRNTRATLHFNEKITAPNTGRGGIFPPEAQTHHQATLAGLVQSALLHLPISNDAHNGCSINVLGIARKLPDFVSVTRGPGMRGNLQIGLDVAKGLSVAWQVPLLGVHHMQAHALTPRLVSALGGATINPEFPFLTLLVSGGHTMLVSSQTLTEHKILATSIDIAVGDVLDKCGRLILPNSIKSKTTDTGYARYLSDYAFPDEESFKTWPIVMSRREEVEKTTDKVKNEFGWYVGTPMANSRASAFTFAGLAGAVETNWIRRTDELQSKGEEMSEQERLLFARTCLGTAFEHLASRTVIVLEDLQYRNQLPSTLVVSGGVASNTFLRYYLRKMLDVRGFGSVALVFPPVWLCTDNAAMIAWTGIEMFQAGWRSQLNIGPVRKWTMDSASPDGGIPGLENSNYTRS